MGIRALHAMKKIVIPAILTATILIAGMFAFMPVEKASSVHTTIQAGQATVFSQTVAHTTAAAVAEVRDFTLNCTSDCVITSIVVQSTVSGATANVASVQAIEVDGIQCVADLGVATNDVMVNLADTAAVTDLDERLEQLFTGFTAAVPVDLVVNLAVSPAVDALSQGGVNSRCLFNGGIAPDSAGIRDVVVEVNFSTQAVAATTVQVTFSGFMVGTTEPAVADEVDA